MPEPSESTFRPPWLALALATGSVVCLALFGSTGPTGEGLFWYPSPLQLGLLLGHVALGVLGQRATLRFRGRRTPSPRGRAWTVAVGLPLLPFLVLAPFTLFGLFLTAVMTFQLFLG